MICGSIEYIWLIGYVFLIVNIVTDIIKKDVKSDLFRLEIINFIFCILWANFMMGYCRYAYIIPVLFSIIMVLNFKKYFSKPKKIFKILASIELVILIVLFLPFFNKHLNINFFAHYVDVYKEKSKMLGKDKDFKIHIDGAWGCFLGDGGLTSLVREEGTPIYNLKTWYIEGSDFFKNKYLEKVTNKDIYIIQSTQNDKKYLEELEKLNFEIVEELEEYNSSDVPYIPYFDVWKIYKIRYKNV